MLIFGSVLGFGGKRAGTTTTVIGTFGVAQTTGRVLGAGGIANHGGFQFTATVTGTISQIRATVTVGGAVNFTAELWTDSAASPGSIIGTASDAVDMTGTGDKTFTFGSPPSVTASTTYWMILKNAGTTDVTFSVCGNQAGYGSGRHDTITSITDNGLGASEEWRVEVTQIS